MKDLFKHASSSWVKYDRYEWKKDKNNKFYITPAPNAMPKIYDPLKEYQQMVLDALNVGLMIRTSSKRKIREAIMEFVTKYGLLFVFMLACFTSISERFECIFASNVIISPVTLPFTTPFS